MRPITNLDMQTLPDHGVELQHCLQLPKIMWQAAMLSSAVQRTEFYGNGATTVATGERMQHSLYRNGAMTITLPVTATGGDANVV